MRWGFLIWELIFIYCRLLVLILVVFVLFLLSLRFGQISPLAFFWWFTKTSDRNAELVITAFHSCRLSHHIFDQENLWPAWVGFETTIFWQCSSGTVETQRLYPLRHGTWRVAVNHLKKARGEIWPKRSERRNNTKTTKMRTKSPQ